MTGPREQSAATTLELPPIVWGAWRLADDPDAATPAGARRRIDQCLELGISAFDHADIYGSYACESLFGAALAEAPGLRDRMQLISKCGICLVDPARPNHRVKHYDASAAHIIRSVEQSLRNLRTEWLDVLLLHRPDPLMNADEVADALSRLVADGKVAHVGVSNFRPHQVELLASRLDRPIATNQVEISLSALAPLTDGTLDQCQTRKIAPMAWSPLAGGRLFTANDGRTAGVRRALDALSPRYDASPDQLALAWLRSHPAGIVPVIGSMRPDRIASAAGALRVELERQDWFTLYEAALGHEVA